MHAAVGLAQGQAPSLNDAAAGEVQSIETNIRCAGGYQAGVWVEGTVSGCWAESCWKCIQLGLVLLVVSDLWVLN